MKIDRELFRLAIPNILSNITVPLLSSVDTALMGHLSAAHLGAVGMASMIFNFIFWNFGFLRMGTTGFIAQSYGRNDHREIADGLIRGFILALGISLCLLLLKGPIFILAEYLLDIPATQRALVMDYFSIRIWAAPASLLLYVLVGWFFGMQNSLYPLIITVVINILNIGLSYYWVFICQWGIEGVALGTLSAELMGLVIAFFLLMSKYKKLIKIELQRIFATLEGWKVFFTVNRDLFLRTLLLTGSFALLYRESAGLGPIFLAGTVVILQFINWMSYAIDGMAYATESLVGKYAGSKSSAVLSGVIRKSFQYGALFAFTFSLGYYLLYDLLVNLFTNDIEVISWMGEMQIFVFLMPLIFFFSYIWDGIFIGYIASRPMFYSMLASFIVYVASFSLFLGYFKHAIWIAFVLFMGSRALFQWFFWRFYPKYFTV